MNDNKINILYISTVFPKKSESSTIYTDLAEELVSHGHNVSVVAAEEKKKSTGTHFENERGCTVLRVKIGNMYDVGFVEKGISLLTLESKMRKAIKKHFRGDSFDLILFEAPPVTVSGVVKTAKRLFHAPAFLMMKDIFPQNAVDIGIIKKGSFIERFFKVKEKELYKTADNIGCMSEGNRQYIATHSNVPFSKLSVFPNTKKISKIPDKDISIRDKYNIPQNKVVFVFGGNMGKPQGMDFLAGGIKMAEALAKDAFFVLVGRGTEKNKVREILKNCNNVVILDALPREAYEALISNCDVGIVSLDNRFSIPNYPSRILSYMEYGMPVLAATDKNTDFKELILEAQCGYWCESVLKEDFVENVKKLCVKEVRMKYGSNGRQYLEDNLTVKTSVRLLEEYFHNQSLFSKI